MRTEPDRDRAALSLAPYTPSDLEALLVLFHETVHTVCARDYSAAQLDAWAPETPDRDRWNESLLAHDTLVARMEGRVAGFGDLDHTGYLDRLYVRWDRQGQGIGSALCMALEVRAIELGCAAVTTHASVTARPFFERRGYLLVRAQEVERAGQRLTNFVMEKPLPSFPEAKQWSC